MAIKDYIIYTHHDGEISTIGQFLDNFGLSIVKDWTAEDLILFSITPEGSSEPVSNYDRILAMYDRDEEKNFSADGVLLTSETMGALFLKVGTKLAIPKSKLNNEVALISGFDQTEPIESIDNFMAGQLMILLSDDRYYPIDKTDLGQGQGVLNTQYPNMSVWVWCRALSPEDSAYIIPNSRDKNLPDFLEGANFGSSAELRRSLVKHFGIDGNLIDITPFIYSAQTSVDGSGGNFSLSLAAVEGERDKALGWRPSKKTLDLVSSGEFVAQSMLNKYNKDKEIIERSKFLLHNIIQPNDLVFIRYETLALEDDRREGAEEYAFIIDKNNIAGKVYDMIGLVDSNSISTNSNNTVEISIDVRGRDLTKLLLEDGSYFYPLAYTNFKESDHGDQKLLKRLSVTGKYPLFGEKAYRSIQYSIEFIINQVSNVTIVPDNLFTSYGDRVSKTLQFDTANEENQKAIIKDARDRVEESIRNSRKNDKLALDSLSEEESQVTLAFNNMLKFIKACQSNWVFSNATLQASTWKAGTYNGETVDFAGFPQSWQGLLYDRNASGPVETFQNTWSVKDAQGNIISETITNNKLNKWVDQAVDWMMEYVRLLTQDISKHEPLPMAGIWQIIKLAFDPQIDSLRISDPSISQPDGPLINQMRKICQEPFVEFFGDTYGDFYHFIARRPPWNQSSIRRYIEDLYTTNLSSKTPSQKDIEEVQAGTWNGSREEEDTGVQLTANYRSRKFLIEIYEEDVISDSLSFYDGEVYSFYELNPQAGFLGAGSEVPLGYIPIVQIPAYAEIYGSKRLKVINQYTKFDGSWRLQAFQKTHVIKQAALDLTWIVETNAYLPFTRQGKITINGDRRIKRGTFIKYHPTGEIFYVTAVSQDIAIGSNIDRTTTIQVERGMVERYIDNVEETDEAGDSFQVSYFNIVDLGSIDDYVENFATNMNYAGKIMQTFVNHNVLNFFLKRNQFKDENESESPG